MEINRKEWTASEVKYLLLNNKKKPLKEIASHLGRSLYSVENKIVDLNKKGYKFVNRSKNEWTFEEDEILLKNFGRSNIDLLVKRLKRTRKAINHRLVFMFGTCEVEEITDCYRIASICEIMGIHRSSVTRFLDNGELKFIQFDKANRIVDGEYFWKWLKSNIHRINPANITEDVYEISPQWYRDEIDRLKREGYRIKNTRWSPKEKALLKFLLMKDMSYSEISEELNRSYDSVCKMARKIFLQNV